MKIPHDISVAEVAEHVANGMTCEQKLDAICARINGEWDHPLLRKFLCSDSTIDDVLAIAKGE